MYKIKKDTYYQIDHSDDFQKICNVSFIFIKRLEKGLRLTSLILRVGDPKFFYRQLVLKDRK